MEELLEERLEERGVDEMLLDELERIALDATELLDEELDAMELFDDELIKEELATLDVAVPSLTKVVTLCGSTKTVAAPLVTFVVPP